MGAHNLLFWLSLAAGAVALGLIGLFKMIRGPAPEIVTDPEAESPSTDA